MTDPTTGLSAPPTDSGTNPSTSTPEAVSGPPTVPGLPAGLSAEGKAAASGIGDRLLSIPMGRWMRIVRRFDMSQDEILEDTTALLIVAANEKVREETGKDDWDRVEAMNLRQINAYLDLGTDEAEAALELEDGVEGAPKSDDGGGEGAPAAPRDDVSRPGDTPE